MGSEEIIMLASRLGVGAVASFLAILLWSKTRDSAWMFIVMGTILAYSEVIFTSLEELGIIYAESGSEFGFFLLRLAAVNLPTVFYGIAFLVMVLRRSV